MKAGIAERALEACVIGTYAGAARGRSLGAAPRALPPATAPRDDVHQQRMLHIDAARGTIEDRRLPALAGLVRRGDVLVLNDAATLPAALAVEARGRSLELRLAGQRADGTWRAILFGEGSWRDDTDARPAPPTLAPGERLAIHPFADASPRPRARGAALAHATVLEVDARSARLLTVRFDLSRDAFFRLLYGVGRPVQYSYHAARLPLAAVQTPYASRPMAVEPPSAGRPLTLSMLAALRAAGAEIVTLTHAAGLSATGDAALDARLPLPERMEIPERTASTVRSAITEGRRVLAVGTSVTRALEGVARLHGEVVAGSFEIDLRIDRGTRLQVVDGLLSGAHDPGSSHYGLLAAFAPQDLLRRAVEASHAGGYLGHELGDSWLLTGARGRANRT